MRLLGVVTHTNDEVRRFVLALQLGGHAVFEHLSGAAVLVGDGVAGELTRIGAQRLIHMRAADAFDAVGVSGYVSDTEALRLLTG